METGWRARIWAELLEDAIVGASGTKRSAGSASKPRDVPTTAQWKLLERELCHGGCRRGVFWGEILWAAHGDSPGEAAEVPRLQGALHRPQDDAEQDDDQGGEEDDAFPVVAHVAAGQPPG